VVQARAAYTLGGGALAVKAGVSAAAKLPWSHWVYRLVAAALAGPALLWLWWRGRREAGYRQALIERLGFANAHPSAHGGLWIHAASVGEAQAALTLWPSIKEAWGAHAITWTTQTPAARALLIERSEGQIHPFFAPLDTVGSVSRFLKRVQPRMLLLLERELWPEWLWQCEQQAITVVVANARLKQSNVTQWPNSSEWLRKRVRTIHRFLCADESSYQSFIQMGVEPHQLAQIGNLKFDQAVLAQPSDTLIHALSERTVVVAASTHAADEDALLANWPEWARQHPKALLVLAPRHPQRFGLVTERLKNLLGSQAASKLAIWSQQDHIAQDTQVLLLDTIGDLTQLYPLATVCLMGGTWSTVGGHNALEPLAAGCPVLFGPHTQQFPDLYADMERAGGALKVNDSEIWQHVSQIIRHPDQLNQMRQAGIAFVKTHQGSAGRTLALLKKIHSWPIEPMPPVALGGNTQDRVWFDPTMLAQIEPPDFEVSTHNETAQTLATGSGRGQAFKIKIQGVIAVLRHYKRGGLVAKLRADTYPAAPVALSRAMKEYTLLREMRSLGLPVPRPLAARCTRTHPKLGHWSSYRADVLVELLPQTRNLAELIKEEHLPEKAWQCIGTAIAGLHNTQIMHSDLNCHNILINESGKVWIIDFDKCARQSGERWKADNLSRLKRSLKKESAKIAQSCFDKNNWEALAESHKNASKQI